MPTAGHITRHFLTDSALAFACVLAREIHTTTVGDIAGANRRTRVMPSQNTSQSPSHEPSKFPVLLTVDEAADLLRTTRRGIYAMIARRQLPGVIRIRRRVLVRSADLLHWLRQKRALSPEE